MQDLISEAVPAERLAEAGVWIARLHGDRRDRAVEAGFRKWLKSNAVNERAFELATEVWEDSQKLSRLMSMPAEAPAAASRWPLGIAAAIAVGITFLFGRALIADGVATAVGEQRLLTLDDGSRVFLNTASEVVVHYDNMARRIDLREGEALFSVARKSAWPFIVRAGDREVLALGTSFAVKRRENNVSITLIDGEVLVAPTETSGTSPSGTTAPRNEVVRLNPGQRVTFSGRESAALDSPSLDKALAWRRGQVILDDTPLSSAVDEMNRYSPIKLVIERPESGALRINGLFQTGDSLNFANAVARAYGLRVIEEKRMIRLVGKPGKLALRSPDGVSDKTD